MTYRTYPEHEPLRIEGEAYCGSCGSISPIGAKFCCECGHRLVQNRINALATPSPISLSGSLQVGASVERRQMTIMFCDLVGSTALSSRVDPEDLRHVIDACHRCVSRVAVGFEGVVAARYGRWCPNLFWVSASA